MKFLTAEKGKEKVVENKSKPKYNFGSRELDHVFLALWAQFRVSHGRLTVEIHLFLLLEASSAGRIGLYFVEGVRYRV